MPIPDDGCTCFGRQAPLLFSVRRYANTNIETPNRNAETDTKSLRPCRRGAYVDTRRGIPSRPAAKRGANVRLKNTNVPQKWTFASISLNESPVIFGSQ